MADTFYKLPKTVMTPTYIIVDLKQLLFLNKFSFISEGKENYHLGQTWLKVISEQTLSWQPQSWTAPAVRTQRIKLCVLKQCQVKLGLSWHENKRNCAMYESAFFKNKSWKWPVGQKTNIYPLTRVWNYPVLTSNEKYLGYIPHVQEKNTVLPQDCKC